MPSTLYFHLPVPLVEREKENNKNLEKRVMVISGLNYLEKDVSVSRFTLVHAGAILYGSTSRSPKTVNHLFKCK